MKKFLECILAFLGFAGCNIIGNSEEAYGTPYADFEVKGLVTNGTNPIENVQISYGEPQYRIYSTPSDTTDFQGNYNFVKGIFPKKSAFMIVATDLNGKYESDTIIDTVYNSDFKGKKKKDEWYCGKATKTVNFTLKEKNDK